MSTFKKIIPLLNRIVVRKIQPELKSKTGIILSKSTQGNTYGVVIEAGPGNFDSNGNIIQQLLKVGDTVLLPEYGGQKVKLGEQQLFIFKDSEIIAKVE